MKSFSASFVSSIPDNVSMVGCSLCQPSLNSDLFKNSSTLAETEMYQLTTERGSVTEIQDDNGLYSIPWPIIIFWCIIYCCISIAALIGNSLVMWVVTVSRKMRTVTNMFIANLALSDFIIGLFTIPFQFQAALLQRWNLPDFMCAFCPFVQVLSVNVSVFTLSAIAVDRYRAVCYPFKPQISKRRAVGIIFFIWIMGLLIALPTELDYKVSFVNDTVDGETKPFCNNVGLNETFRVCYSFSLLVIQYVLPLLILSGAYARMATKLWGTEIPGNKEESRDALILRNKKKAIKMLALVVVLFSVCWLPLQLYNVLQFFIPSINSYKYINLIWFCLHWLAMSNSCVNPFIYAIYNDKFQREFKTRLSWVFTLCGYCKNIQSEHNEVEANHFDDLRRDSQFVCLGTDFNTCSLRLRRQSQGNIERRFETTTNFSQPVENRDIEQRTDNESLHMSSARPKIISKIQSEILISANELVEIHSNNAQFNKENLSNKETCKTPLRIPNVKFKRINECSALAINDAISLEFKNNK